MRPLKFALLCLSTFLSVNMLSQTKSASIKKIYHYTFNGIIAPENVSSFEQRLSQLPNVNSAKVKYKAQSKKGELFVETSESVKSYEGEEGFDVIALKKLILTYDLEPNELKINLIK